MADTIDPKKDNKDAESGAPVQLDEEQQRKAGVPPDMVRLSIGLESLDDILWDLDRALGAAP